MDLTATYGIDNHEEYVRYEGLQIKATAIGGNPRVILNRGSGSIYASNNIIVGDYSDIAPPVAGFDMLIGGINYVWNNIIYNIEATEGSGGAGIRSGGGTLYAYNNTEYNSRFGLRVEDGIFITKNNIAYNNTDNYNGGFSGLSANNLSGPTQTDAPGSNSVNAATVTFADETNNNFHLSSTDTSARDAGINLSSDVYLSFSDDIDGTIRENVWDIGAHELIPKPKDRFSPGGTFKLEGKFKFE